MAIEERRMRFTVERYERMVEAGILTKDDRVELIDGEIVEMTPIGPPHSTIVGVLVRIFYMQLADRASIRSQSPSPSLPTPNPNPTSGSRNRPRSGTGAGTLGPMTSSS